MATTTVENYIKQIYLQQEALPDGSRLVGIGRVAEAVGVTAGTGTTMMKSLADAGLVDYQPREGVRLTRGGTRLAVQVLRRHRLTELFLVEVLRMDWADVHEEAEELEHVISDRVLEHIDNLLGHPEFDPHGDPIPPPPRGDTKHPPRTAEHDASDDLTTCPLNQPLRVRRVLDQDPTFLRFLDRHGLTPGSPVTVRSRTPAAQSVTVRTAKHKPITLGLTAAAKITVAGG